MENNLSNHSNTSFFTPFLTAKIVIGSLVKSIIMIVLFVYFAKKIDVTTAGSLMFIFLIGHELLFSFSCRNLKHSVINKSLFSNKRLSLGILIIFIIQIVVLTTNLSQYFIVDNIGLNNVIITLSVCLITFILGELFKPIYTKLFKDYTEVK